MFKKLLKASALLAVFNVLGGGFHYLYQVVAARRLIAVDLGTLNVEMTLYTLAASLALVTQYFVVLQRPSEGQLKKVRIASWAVLLAGLFWFLAGLQGAIEVGPRVICMTLVPIMFFTHYWLGFFQARQVFWAFGTGMFLFALFKVISAYIIGESVTSFAWALYFGGWCALFFLLVLPLGGKTAEDASVKRKDDVVFAFLAAFAFVLFPAYDLLNIKWMIGSEEAGRFSQLQLFARVLYFAPVTLLQVTLPHYVRAFRESEAQSLKSIRTLEIAGLGVCYAAALVLAFVGPTIARMLFKIEGLTSPEILLCCLAITPLYGLLASVQIYAASKQLAWSLVTVVSVALSPIGVAVLKIQNLNDYLMYSACVNTGLGLVSLIGVSVYLKSHRGVWHEKQSTAL